MSLQKRLNRVRQAFSPGELVAACALPENGFDEIAQRFELQDKKERYFHFKDNGSNVLAVAHLDSVQTARHCSVSTVGDGSKIVYSPVLDDRLGVYIICSLLPKLGIRPDVLLTIGEETGKSTADLFERTWKLDGEIKKKQYNWMFQFDRAGTDVVMYQYRNADSIKLLKEVGFVDAIGSFSDIARLDDLKCIGFNFGCGYRDYHNYRAYAWLDETFEMVARFTKFFELHSGTAMAHHKSSQSFGSHMGRGSYGHYYNGTYYSDEEWKRKEPQLKIEQELLEQSVMAYEISIGNEKPDRFTEYGYWRKVSATEDKAAYEKWRNYHEYKAEIKPVEQPKPEKEPLDAEGRLKVAKKIEDKDGPYNSIQIAAHGYWVTRGIVQTYKPLNWEHYKARHKVKKDRATVEQKRFVGIAELFGLDAEKRLAGRKKFPNDTATNGFDEDKTLDDECMCGHKRYLHYGGSTRLACNQWKCNCYAYLERNDTFVGGI